MLHVGLEEEGRGKRDSRGSAGGVPSVEVEPAGGAGLGEDRCLFWIELRGARAEVDAVVKFREKV